MKSCGFSDLDDFISVGPIRVDQCPAFYQLLDGLVFPSLLECFSASPIEAMKMNIPVFASNYPFITDATKNAAIYFDALDAKSIAESIANTFADPSLMEIKRDLGSALVKRLPSAKDRAYSYLNIISK
jgi:glycosyltransferase involved in cell wall biosynthesis